ncbi:MAG: hypothetical protein NTU86_04475 [Burkholderiales bacterium]|nr:hypothetical protein [Burkholderiales bacterium]
MRLQPDQATFIRNSVHAIAGDWARVSHSMHGRKVDVLIKAPNL